MQETGCIEPGKCESILHMDGQAQYVQEVLQGVYGLNPVCMEGMFARAGWDKPRLLSLKATQPGLSWGAEEEWYKRVRSKQEKSLQQKRGPHLD